jgi:hypothetical protein
MRYRKCLVQNLVYLCSGNYELSLVMKERCYTIANETSFRGTITKLMNDLCVAFVKSRLDTTSRATAALAKIMLLMLCDLNVEFKRGPAIVGFLTEYKSKMENPTMIRRIDSIIAHIEGSYGAHGTPMVNQSLFEIIPVTMTLFLYGYGLKIITFEEIVDIVTEYFVVTSFTGIITPHKYVDSLNTVTGSILANSSWLSDPAYLHVFFKLVDCARYGMEYDLVSSYGEKAPKMSMPRFAMFRIYGASCNVVHHDEYFSIARLSYLWDGPVSFQRVKKRLREKDSDISPSVFGGIDNCVVSSMLTPVDYKHVKTFNNIKIPNK